MQDAFQAPFFSVVLQQSAVPLQFVVFAAEHLAFGRKGLQYFDPCLLPFPTERAHTGARAFCALLALAGAFSGNWLVILQMLGHAGQFSQPGVGRTLPQRHLGTFLGCQLQETPLHT